MVSVSLTHRKELNSTSLSEESERNGREIKRLSLLYSLNVQKMSGFFTFRMYRTTNKVQGNSY